MVSKKVKYLFIILTILMAFNLVGCEKKKDQNKSESSTPVSNSESKPVKKDNNIANKSNTTQTGNTSQSDLSTVSPEADNNAIKDRLLAEFNEYLKKVQSGDDSEYNLIMASDRAYGLSTAFPLTKEEDNFIQSNYMEVRAPLKYSIVYNGYSKDGIHFTAIMSPDCKENEAYKDVANKIRNSADEYEFLSYVLDSSPERLLYVGIDVYAEDLTGTKKSIKLDKITLSDPSWDPDNQQPETPIFGESINKILSKYSRNTNENYLIDNGSWCPFVFEGVLVSLPEIYIYYNNEIIRLEK